MHFSSPDSHCQRRIWTPSCNSSRSKAPQSSRPALRLKQRREKAFARSEQYISLSVRAKKPRCINELGSRKDTQKPF